MLQVIEVASVESTGPLWSVSIVQAPVIVVLVAVTTHGYSEINFIVCVPRTLLTMRLVIWLHLVILNCCHCIIRIIIGSQLAVHTLFDWSV